MMIFFLLNNVCVKGAIYNADFQCRLQFNSTDEDVKVCDPHKICTHLWCTYEGRCESYMMPAAPGTKCDKQKVI